MGKTWRKIIVVAQIIIGALFIGTLFTINFTSYSGYSYKHCNAFDWENYLQTAEAHEILRTSSPDDIRISDLYKVQESLEHYLRTHGSYPVATDHDYIQNWKTISLILSESVHGHFPFDPCNERNSNYQYIYLSTEEGDGYVLGALLSDTDYRYVSAQYEDIDGLVLGVWCGEGKFEREFCLTSPN